MFNAKNEPQTMDKKYATQDRRKWTINSKTSIYMYEEHQAAAA